MWACPSETETFISFVVVHSDSSYPLWKGSSCHGLQLPHIVLHIYCKVTKVLFPFKLGKFKTLSNVSFESHTGQNPLFIEQTLVLSFPLKLQWPALTIHAFKSVFYEALWPKMRLKGVYAELGIQLGFRAGSDMQVGKLSASLNTLLTIDLIADGLNTPFHINPLI